MYTVDYAKTLISYSKTHSNLKKEEGYLNSGEFPHRFDIRVYTSWKPSYNRVVNKWTIAAPNCWHKTNDEPGLIVGWKKLDSDWDNVLVWYEKIGRWGIVPMAESCVNEYIIPISMGDWMLSEPYIYKDNPDLDMLTILRYMVRDNLEDVLWSNSAFF